MYPKFCVIGCELLTLQTWKHFGTCKFNYCLDLVKRLL